MATFLEMKTRIAEEINRTDLTTAVESAVLSAIDFYQASSFWYSEDRMRRYTVADQEYYPLPQNYIKDISFFVQEQNYNYTLHKRPDTFFTNRQSPVDTGVPKFYGIIDQQIRLSPIPDAAYYIEMHLYKQFSEPVGDSEENSWTQDLTEQLVRYRAKKDLYVNYLHDLQMYQAMQDMEAQTLAQMSRRTVKYRASGYLSPEDYSA